MDKVTINWNENCVLYEMISNSDHKYLDEHGFYAILTGIYDKVENTYKSIKLHYIGKAYEQTIRERVLQKHTAYDCIKKYLKEDPRRNVLVMTGKIVKYSVGKITKQLVDDTEACLIYTNQPLCNTMSKNSYEGRDIEIINTGDYLPLKEKSVG
ncbi:hypothetical protein [Treponema sp. OMZ 857]|uniref:hypothetical protein n=1 Tax=Treponema sp. OMZ 857 TaxID=1643513 RepID=UPI0020A4CA02|nr:hypothetical protein [Treponema sp. OMZ 857]UTC44434.1 hypothetical protein E4N66_10380 [Treponema sp. OMZ 857]